MAFAELQAVTKQYGEIQALRGVDLSTGESARANCGGFDLRT